MARRVLLLIPTSSYRTDDFMAAAESLGVAISVASEEASSVTSLDPDALLTLDFSDPADAVEQVEALASRHSLDAVVGVDDRTIELGAVISAALDLGQNSPEAVRAARDKREMRRLLAAAGVPQPRFGAWPRRDSPDGVVPPAYPCVVKPCHLSGSRAVIRADDRPALVAAWGRVESILERRDLEDEAGDHVLVEEYIDGWEVAVEGMITSGRLQPLAIFDKPDPLVGPTFPETIYVTPSRLAGSIQEAVATVTADACAALGLRHGPVHAELRGNGAGVFVIEVAARSIGGLCSRALRFGIGRSLEELILTGALGDDVSGWRREDVASGVLMMPAPSSGRVSSIGGVEAARAVPGIEEVTMTVRPGQSVEALPEGAIYLGFAFARGADPGAVEASLRAADRCLQVIVAE